ncbi:phage portal protein [Myxococcus stipitatus DSM 14675]|uniref:Phage portal protein n=1 Tax=Myxococcus stipitatus (strain DSM 14675 / JCM 12634 / Mx s8) TaxID=1278073 RepID=L7U545_MYXSD|nr:phage portal protein [Myxococcus stipitatus]AGC43263.1 phage portal protein [Myxococcus stipitatus DSM 14675]
MMNALDKFTARFAPRWTLERVRARMTLDTAVRHYEAAQQGRRTSGWARSRGDANATAGSALAELRMHARDLERNCGWARRGLSVIAGNTVAWGIVPRPKHAQAKDISVLWKSWAESLRCESGGRLTFYGLQELVVRSVARDGEILIRRRPRRPEDGLAVPLQLQVLEADYLDTAKDNLTGEAGGPIIQGIEYDKLDRRVAYWLFPEHPGSARSVGQSKRIPASEVATIYLPERAGQGRGVSWLAASVLDLKDFDEFEDAELSRQKVAAMFAGYMTDADGVGGGAFGESDKKDPLTQHIQPGTILSLPPGRQVTMANPPSVVEGTFAQRRLRKVAASWGVTYEDLTGDYSQVNYSSARMARVAHWRNVHRWQWHMVVPQLCQVVWGWFIEAAALAGLAPEGVEADWTVPPMPMIEPVQEGLAYSRLIRNGVLTHAQAILEQGRDPELHWDEYREGLDELDKREIWLDSDPRRTSAAGLTQERAGLNKGGDTSEEGG